MKVLVSVAGIAAFSLATRKPPLALRKQRARFCSRSEAGLASKFGLRSRLAALPGRAGKTKQKSVSPERSIAGFRTLRGSQRQNGHSWPKDHPHPDQASSRRPPGAENVLDKAQISAPKKARQPCPMRSWRCRNERLRSSHPPRIASSDRLGADFSGKLRQHFCEKSSANNARPT